MLVKTETGSVYHFVTIYDVSDQPHWYVIRSAQGEGGKLRRDDDYIELVYEPYAVEGEPMTLYLEPLGEGDITVRTTSPVTEIVHGWVPTVPQELPREQGLW